MRDPVVVRRGVAACRDTLADAGILLVQDSTLPSVTTLVAGEPVRGSWWSHEQAHSIFDVLQELEPDATMAKLVAKKQTLVHRGRWPELAAVGAERAAWQLDGLAADARAVVEQIDAAEAAIRSDALVVVGTRTRSTVVREVEVRLLFAVDELHTESGRHAKVLQEWARWAAAADIRTPLPDSSAARRAFEAVVRSWSGDRVTKLLPWPMEDPS